MLEALRKPLVNPRKPSVKQLYLTANKDRVREIYERRIATSALKGIALRNAIAEELLQAESEEVQAEWQSKAKEAYDALVQEYEAAKEGNPSSDPEAQEE